MKLHSFFHVDVDPSLLPLISQGITSPSSLTDQTIATVQNKEAIEAISFKSQSRLTKEVICAFPNLKLLIARTVGTDNVDLEECKKRNIALYHIPDYGSQNIAELALGLLLAGARHIITANQEVHTGKYSYRNFLGTSLKGKTVGVVGTGKIGLSLIRLLQPFRVTILAFDVYQNQKESQKLGFAYVSLIELLRTSDIVSVHVPLMASTRHLIGEKELHTMKPGSILVNTSRGAIIDTHALVAAVGKFQAVGLDVIEDEESFSSTHPLLGCPNVIITPHIGFFTDDAIRKIATETMKCIEKFETGDAEGRIL